MDYGIIGWLILLTIWNIQVAVKLDGYDYWSILPSIKRPRDEEQPRVIPNLNTVNALVTEGVKLNQEMQVARVLIHQKREKLKVDLTEKFWLVRKNYDGTREEFVEMLSRWERDGAVQKGRGKTATYTVIDWDKIRHYSVGHSPTLRQ